MQGWATILILLSAVVVAACGRSESSSPQAPRTPSPGTQHLRRELRVAAAASLKPALTEIAEQFEKNHAGVTVTLTFGSSGNLYAQLTQQAPFDVFLSADAGYPRKLAETGLTLDGASHTFARGQLVIWEYAKEYDLSRDGPEGLKLDSIKHIAIANPETAPYGRAAKQALTKLGLWEPLQPKLVIGENVEQVAQFLASGAAEAGLLPLSLTHAGPLRDTGAWLAVEESAYDPIEHALAVMKTATDGPLATEFSAAVRSQESGAILKRNGLAPVAP